MKRIPALALGDFRNVVRDSTLVLVLFAPVALFLFLRLAVPLATDVLQAELGFDLSAHYLFVVSFMSLLPAMLFGLIFGFIILEERDEEIIAYMAVTPLRKNGYLAYKLMAPLILSLLFFFVIVYLTGLATIPLKYAFALALLVALEAPLGALFLAAFAENKVAGLALSKGLGMIYFAPFVAYFVESDWQYLAGIFPPFWVTKAFVAAQEQAGVYWLFVVTGLFVHIAALLLLLKRFTDSQR